MNYFLLNTLIIYCTNTAIKILFCTKYANYKPVHAFVQYRNYIIMLICTG